MNRRNFLLSTASISALPFIPAVPVEVTEDRSVVMFGGHTFLTTPSRTYNLAAAQRWQNAWMSTALQRIMDGTHDPNRIIQEPSISDDSDDYEPDYNDEYDL